MNNHADDDRTDEEILTYAVSDEALEVAAGNEGGGNNPHFSGGMDATCYFFCC